MGSPGTAKLCLSPLSQKWHRGAMRESWTPAPVGSMAGTTSLLWSILHSVRVSPCFLTGSGFGSGFALVSKGKRQLSLLEE